MTEHVISHRAPRRKRGRRALPGRRFVALAITLAALAAASWLAPSIYRAPPPTPAPEAVEVAAPPKLPGEAVKAPPFAQPAPTVQARRPRPPRRAVPLDAAPENTGDDFEVLSAAELDAISQARD